MILSRGERITLEGLASGLKASEIAAREGWKGSIPHTYAHRAKRKLRCRTRIQTVVVYMTTERGRQ